MCVSFVLTSLALFGHELFYQFIIITHTHTYHHLQHKSNQHICIHMDSEATDPKTLLPPGIADLPTYGPDSTEYVLEKDLSCAICQDILINPIVLNCSHSFCKFCVYRWLDKRSKCPECRMLVTFQAENLALKNVIDKLVTKTSKQFQATRQQHVLQRINDEQQQVDDGTACRVSKNNIQLNLLPKLANVLNSEKLTVRFRENHRVYKQLQTTRANLIRLIQYFKDLGLIPDDEEIRQMDGAAFQDISEFHNLADLFDINYASGDDDDGDDDDDSYSVASWADYEAIEDNVIDDDPNDSDFDVDAMDEDNSDASSIRSDDTVTIVSSEESSDSSSSSSDGVSGRGGGDSSSDSSDDSSDGRPNRFGSVWASQIASGMRELISDAIITDDDDGSDWSPTSRAQRADRDSFESASLDDEMDYVIRESQAGPPMLYRLDSDVTDQDDDDEWQPVTLRPSGDRASSSRFRLESDDDDDDDDDTMKSDSQNADHDTNGHENDSDDDSDDDDDDNWYARGRGSGSSCVTKKTVFRLESDTDSDGSW